MYCIVKNHNFVFVEKIINYSCKDESNEESHFDIYLNPSS